ncbi:hydrogenase expression/formation protein HypE [Phaeacidiphilus oryzae]|uniref:hydrogenase expression/formation protein HypE n=1 Tax=Phaeacidiphilus oryzae TaxID=348818 RepID=UPI0009FD5077|nr:hydrogenase expression/formation protein HypE [Phaeacidiphilus oryzae]
MTDGDTPGLLASGALTPGALAPGAGLACPAPADARRGLGEDAVVLLGHGAGGRLSEELLRGVLLPAMADGGEPATAAPILEDAAVLPGGPAELVFSTDAFVVDPLFFPGGDIGSLAVHGTVNDVAMMGAEPFALALALIVEEGLPIPVLDRVARSVGRAARAAGVRVVTGDTKVVGRGSADGLYLTTTGLGRRLPGIRPSAAAARPGDEVLISGPIGLHGTTVLSTREGLGFEADIASDSRPLHTLVKALAEAVPDAVRTLRDPTRGGVAASLNEIARDSSAAAGRPVGIELDESALPVPAPVAAACEILGLDVLHVANEGCLLAFVRPDRAADALAALRSAPGGAGAGAARIGRVTDAGRVVLHTLLGSRRTVEMPTGEQLPRIC